MKKYYFENAVFFLCLLLIVIISACTTLYSDDFVYGTYFCDGFKNFLDMSREHYLNVNGRALVHFVLEVVLIFKDRLFGIVIPLMLIMLAEMFCLIICDKSNRRIEFYAFYLLGIIFLPLEILREGVLWMAGAMNYIFPTVVTLAGFYAVKKTCDENRVKWYYYLLMLIGGATTEQGGAMLISATVLYIVSRLLNKHILLKQVYVLLVLAAVGYATVVLSPGTFLRMASETVSAAVSVYDGFEKLYITVLKDGNLIWILAVTGVAVSSIIGKEKFVAAILEIVLIAASMAVFMLGRYMASGIILTVALVIGGVCLLSSEENAGIGALLLSALISLGMLGFSTTYGYRNFLPAYLIAVCICSKQILIIFNRMNKNKYLFCTTLLLTSALVYFLPTLKGYAENRKIINENLSNIVRNGEGFYYNADLNKDYSYNQFFDYSFYYDGFKKIYGINKETKIYITGEEFEDLYFNGIHCENPVYVKNDIKYYPLRDIAEESGGKVEWNNETREACIYFANNTVYYNENNKIFHTKNKWFDSRKYKLNDEDKYGRFFITHIYMTKENIEEMFGIRLNIKGPSEEIQ